MTTRTIFYILAGYGCGSILFAPLFGRLFAHRDICRESPDKNPGTANAFRYGGFRCGVCTLCGDLLKGYLPVHLFLEDVPLEAAAGLSLVLAAPVIGHIFPFYRKFRGGKGIAASFGVLLGLFPCRTPFLLLAASFVLFSTVLRITPHYSRTIFTYLLTTLLMVLLVPQHGVAAGFGLITAAVLLRLLGSREERDPLEVRLLWKR